MVSLDYKFVVMTLSKGFQAIDPGRKTGMPLEVKKVNNDIWRKNILCANN